jgi:hypothetical protein
MYIMIPIKLNSKLIVLDKTRASFVDSIKVSSVIEMN